MIQRYAQLSYQAVFLNDQKVRKKFEYLKTKRAFHNFLPSFCLGGNRFSKKTLPEGMRNFPQPRGIVKNMGANFAYGARVKMFRFDFFWLTNAFSSNLNKINLKIFHKHGGICKFEINIDKRSGKTWNPKQSIELWEDGWFSTLYHFVDLNLGVKIFFGKKEAQKKGALILKEGS